MDLSRPFRVITPTVDGDVLLVLAATTAPRSVSQVHQALGRGSLEGVRNALTRLTGQGMVSAGQYGRQKLYVLNRDHLAAAAVESIAGVRVELLSRIRSRLHAWAHSPLHASVFGSFARGDTTADSDIDLLLIRPPGMTSADVEDVWLPQVAELEDAIWRWVGNPAQSVELDKEQLVTMVRSQDPLIESLRSDAVHLAGERLTTLLRA